jgi:pantetheine-phosphate adenylyltransferase
LITAEEHTFLSGTTVREIASLGGDVSSMVPLHVKIALEHRFIEMDKDSENMPTTSLRD